MPSSTSSFERHIPDGPWRRIAGVMAALTIGFLIGWEVYCRSLGYGPTLNDNPGLWSISRERLRGMGTEAIVVLGDSRIRFDLDHEITSQAFDGRPLVSLAMNGSVAPPVLRELAEDGSFKGLVLCSYTPSLFWAPGGPRMDETIKWLDYEKKETIAQQWGQRLAMPLERSLAMMNKETFSLKPLLKQLPVPDRAATPRFPSLPPYMATTLPDRREIMWEHLETNTEYQKRIQNIWLGLLKFVQPLPPELLGKLRADVVADVQKIRSRGGDVVFIAFPSTDQYTTIEETNAPKKDYWEPLLRECNAVGVHFQDHEELSGFNCPEWSHLTSEDAVEFTTRLMPILKEEMDRRGGK